MYDLFDKVWIGIEADLERAEGAEKALSLQPA